MKKLNKIKKRNTKRKKAQTTVFIILALLFVGGTLIFLILRRSSLFKVSSEKDPMLVLKSCVRESVEEAEDILLRQGGDIDPKLYKLYKGEKVKYLCYTPEYYTPCINLKPDFIAHLRNEIKNFITPKVEECFSTLKKDFSKTYEIKMGKMDLGVELLPRIIEVKIDRKLELKREGKSKSYDQFKFKIPSPLFEFGRTAMEIASQEAKYCHFENVGYMSLNRDIRISRTTVGQRETQSKIYTLEDENSGKKFRIAIRGCAIPPRLI